MAKAKKAKKASKAKKPTAKKSVQKIAKKTAKKVSVKAVAARSSSAIASKVSNWENVLTPLDDRVIIEMTSGERRTAGGLIIPDTASMSGNFQGRVLLVGRGHRDKKGRVRPMDVKPGDTVLISEYSGSKIEVMGRELKILRESEILGILEKQ